MAERPALAGGKILGTFVYLLDLEQGFNPDDFPRIASLLGATGESVGNQGFFITPRAGTISPWSSRATAILHNCGFTSVLRVERGVRIRLFSGDGAPVTLDELGDARGILFDRMTEGVYDDLEGFFNHRPPQPGKVFDVLNGGIEVLKEANETMGLGLLDEEISYLAQAYTQARRNPTDTELLMFGQVNSEHCRHKIFNADWMVDGERQTRSLFQMIKHTHACNPQGTLVAYKDNSGVMEGARVHVFDADPATGSYGFKEDQLDMVMKVETHNHPTAISPFPGAATGVGGEIRDESATGIGSRSKAGLSGLIVSNLRIPGHEQPWELSLIHI